MATYQPNDLAALASQPLDGVIDGWDTEDIVDLFVQLDALTWILGGFRRELRADLAGSIDQGYDIGGKIIRPKREQFLVGNAETIRRSLLEKTRTRLYTVDGAEVWAVPEDDVRQFWTNKNAPATYGRELGMETDWRNVLEVSNL